MVLAATVQPSTEKAWVLIIWVVGCPVRKSFIRRLKTVISRILQMFPPVWNASIFVVIWSWASGKKLVGSGRCSSLSVTFSLPILPGNIGFSLLRNTELPAIPDCEMSKWTKSEFFVSKTRVVTQNTLFRSVLTCECHQKQCVSNVSVIIIFKIDKFQSCLSLFWVDRDPQTSLYKAKNQRTWKQLVLLAQFFFLRV